MSKIEDIECAVEQLSREERERLRDFLDELEERAFDEAIERDAKLGKLDELADAARAGLKAGKGEEF